ncbi:MAG: sulfur carrier protein ThiS [Acutalibacteraceae bacterium]
MLLNGKEFELIEEKILSDFLRENNYAPVHIAVEINGEIIPKADFDKTLLKNTDQIEIVRFVGGG